jgi:putative phosphoesterase
VKRSETLPFEPGGSLRLAVVADTHSRPHPRAREHLAALGPRAILHAGDIGELAVLEDLATVAPVFAVRGNIDDRAASLPDVLFLDLSDGTRTLKLLLTHIAVSGTRLRADVKRMAQTAGAKLVVCGHSHVPFITRDDGVTLFNPGSVGPRRFALPILYGTIDVTPSGVALTHYDCETGRSWSPP